jgi:hypothetical protein
MDTVIEDEDNYRFLADCQARWGVITMLCEGRNPYEVAKDKHIIANQKIAPCTFALKIDVFRKYLTDSYPDASPTIHIGYDFTELHRCEPTRRNYEAQGWGVDFPLLWKPYETRPYAQVVREWGIEPPRMYEMGYSHANCGGRCVKQGQGDWLRTLINFPHRYAEAEHWEAEMRDHPVRKNYAILRDRVGGQVRPLTLRAFRKRHEAGRAVQPSFLDEQYGGCVYCGVGDLLAQSPGEREGKVRPPDNGGNDL